MKIISFNVGNFIFAKYFPGRKHYHFDRGDISLVREMINKENPDVLFLQEIPSDDIDYLFNLFYEYDYAFTIKSDDREAKSIFLSRYKIQEVEHTDSYDYIINGITFFPIHLNAFSPKKRLEQVNTIKQDLPKSKGIIIGDANFWIVNDIFLSSTDKVSFVL